MRRIIFSEGEYYHLYNRGVDKRRIFMSPAEYKRFLAYLLLLNDTANKRLTYDFSKNSSLRKIDEVGPRKSLVAIGAYCLMPNHFHLYVTPLEEAGISKFMQRLQTAYTMYFNEKHDRSGALLQGRFKAEHVATERHAKYLFSYIHLNPAKLKDQKWKELGPRNFRALKNYVGSYPYSSLREYITRDHLITDPKKFPDYLSGIREVNEHVDYWLRFREEIDEVGPHKF